MNIARPVGRNSYGDIRDKHGNPIASVINYDIGDEIIRCVNDLPKVERERDELATHMASSIDHDSNEGDEWGPEDWEEWNEKAKEILARLTPTKAAS